MSLRSVLLLLSATICFSLPSNANTKFNITADVITHTTPLTFCEGGSVKLSVPTIPTATYEWYNNGSVIPAADASSYIATTSGKYKVVVSQGSISTTYTELQVTVYAKPVPKFTHPPDGDCSTNSIQFTNTSTGTDLTYSWDFGDPNSGTNNSSAATNPTHTFIGSPGNGIQSFIVKLSVTNSSGCTEVYTSTVSTMKIPDAKLGGTNLEDFKGELFFKQCSTSPSEFEFINQSSTTASNILYKIEWGDETPDFESTSFNALITHTYDVGIYKLRYAVTGLNGCITIREYNVFVGSNPAGGIISRGNTNICTGGELTFDISGTENNPLGTVYKISYGDGFSETLYHPIPSSVKHVFTTSSCGTKSLTYNNSFAASIEISNPCGSTGGVVAPIYVSKKPEGKITITRDGDNCINKPVSIRNDGEKTTIVSSSGVCSNGKTIWKISPETGWFVTSGSTGNDFSSLNMALWEGGSDEIKVQFTEAQTYTITLVTSGNTICDKDIKTKTICINPLPIAKFDLDAIEGCGPLTVNTTNLSNVPNCGSNSYSWSVVYSNPANCTSASSLYSYVSGNSTSENPVIKFTNPGVYDLTLITKNSDGSCTSLPFTKRITVKSKPVGTIAAPVTICNDVAFNPLAVIANCYSSTTATYLWTFIGANTTSSIDERPLNISYPLAGSYTIKLEVTNECGTTIITKPITVTTAPAVKPVADLAICRGVTQPSIPFSNVEGNIQTSYKWTASNKDIGLPATTGAGSLPIFFTTNNTSAVISSVITVTPQLNGCEGPSTSFTIFVNPSTPVANAGTDQKLCNQSSTILDGNSPGAVNGQWTLVSGQAGVTITDPSQYNSTVTGLQADQVYEFKWRIDGLAPCPATEDNVKIFNRPEVTVADAGPDIIICDLNATNNSKLLQDNRNPARPYETGEWSILTQPVGSAAFFTNQSLPTTSIKNLIPGEYTLKWSIKNDVCTDATESNLKINVFAMPVAGIITGTSKVCFGTNFNLTASAFTGTFWGWQESSDQNIWTDLPATANPVLPITSSTVRKYYRTKVGSESPSCPTIVYSAAKMVDVDPLSVGGTATGASTHCAGSNSGTIALSGNTGAVIRWETSTDDLNFTAIPASAGTSYSYQNLNTSTFYRALVKSGDCGEAVSSSVKITINPLAVIANAGPDQNLCNETTTVLAASEPLGTSGKWTLVSGQTGISFTDDTIFNTEVSGFVTGQVYEFKWTINGTFPCPSSDDNVKVAISALSVGGFSAGATTVCKDTNTGLISLSGETGTIINWQSSINGTTWTDIPSSATTPHRFTNLSQTTYFRAVVKSGACGFAYSSAAIITVLPPVDISNAGSDIHLCNLNGSVSLNANTPVNGTGEWKQLSGPPIGIDGNTNPKAQINIALNGDYVFEWTISNGVCAPSKSTVKLFNYPALVNTIDGDATFCYNQDVAITNLSLSGGNGSYVYRWESSSDNATWANLTGENSSNLNFTAQQTVYIRRVVESGPCTSFSNSVLITVLPAISNNTIGTNQEVCIGKSIQLISGSNPSGGNNLFDFLWQSSTDGVNWVNITGTNQVNYQPLNLLITTFYRRIVSSASCTNAQQSVSNIIKVTINPNAQADFNASATKGCVPFDLSKVINVVPHPDKNSTYEWFANNVSIGTGVSFPGYIMNNDGDLVVIKLITQSKFGCDADEEEISFSTTKDVIALFSKDKTQDCGPTTVNFTNISSPINAASYQWDFGNGQTSTQSQPASITFQAHPLNRDTTYKITLRAITSCGVSIYTDSVTVRPKPIAIFSPDKTIGCSPLEVNFSNQSKGMPNTYTIDFGNGDKVVKTDNGPFSYTYLTAKTDTFTVKLYAENECGIDSSSYDIIVYANTIKPELVVNGGSNYGCAPFSVKFDNNSEGASSFHWDFNDGSTATSNSAPASMLHTFTQAGTYTVTLTATNGCATNNTMETIVVFPQPVASFSSNKLQYCVNEKVIFTNLSSGVYTYIWNFGDGNTSNAIHPTHSFSQSGIFTVKLTAIQTYPDGTSCSTTSSQQVEILAPPVSSFSTNASSLNCAPFTLIVSNSPGNASGGIEWHFDDAGSDDNFAQGYSSKHTFTKPGLYYVKSLAYNQSGCADSTIQQIRVTESPIAEFSTANSMICGLSGTIDFINQSTYSGPGNISYKWFINNTLLSNQKDLKHTFNTPANASLPYIFEVKLIASSTVGCSDTVVHNVQFNPLAKASFSLQTAIDCAPFTVAIVNTSVYADSFKWYLDDVLVSTMKTPTDIILNKANSTYKLKMLAANIYGCNVDEVEKIVRTRPKPVSIFNVNNSLSCNGKLDITTTNNSLGATSFVWNFGDNSPESTDINPSHTYSRAGKFILQLRAFDGFCSDTSTVEITVAPTPKAAFSANTTKGCTKIDVTFENLSDNASSYLWDFGDGTYSGEKTPTRSFSYMQSPYTVKLIAYGAYGCSDTAIITKYIEVTQPPKADFEILPDSIIKIPDYSFSFKNTSTGNPVKYFWDFGDGKISKEENPSYTYADSGFHRVRLIVLNSEGCLDAITKTVHIKGVPGFLFVPNAFEPDSEKHDLRTFRLRGSGMAEYSIKIFNKWGEMIWESNLLDEEGSPIESWDGSMKGQPAPQGVYIWNIYAKFIDGNVWKGMKYEKGTTRKTGSIHLIR